MLDIDRGSVTAGLLLIGSSARGEVNVRGDDSSGTGFGDLVVVKDVFVGDEGPGRLNVEPGGSVVCDSLTVPGPFASTPGLGASPVGEVVVDGQGGLAAVEAARTVSVSATEVREVFVTGGGNLTTKDLIVGDRQVRPGSADVTIRRPAKGGLPALLVKVGSGQAAPTRVGKGAPGELNIQAGASAELQTGLEVGVGAHGIVLVSSQGAPANAFSELKVIGETRVGVGAAGTVQINAEGGMVNNGDTKIGLGVGNPSGSVDLLDNSSLAVNGTLTVGDSGIGVVNLESGSIVLSNTLLVRGEH